MRSETDALVQELQVRPLASVRALRIYGTSFGAPFDKTRRINAATADGELVRLDLADGEKVEITGPHGVEWRPSSPGARELVIKTAECVRVEFVRHGGTNDGRTYFVEYRKADDRIRIESNVDWYTPKVANPHAPALELQ
jgi:hypothetical protein